MNNEIGRKITSLTLMTIMVAGGMTFAVPGVMPAAHAANANLFVSAENSQFNNYFGGPMVVEIVVNDPDIKDTDEAKGEPDVTINGKIVRMVQATDGLWYAYVADRTMAALADLTSTTPGFGLDFGELCANTDSDGSTPVAALFTDTQGFYLGDTTAAAACVPAGGSAGDDDGIASTPALIQENNVVREAKTPNPGGVGIPAGQIGVTPSVWPIVQVYDLNPTGNVVIQYNKGGNPQTVTLTFDTLDGTLSADLDRTLYPRGSAFHATLTDQALNIDPTDEDSWTFNTTPGATSISYQLFDESGNNDGACAVPGSTDASGLTCVAGGAATATSLDVSGSLDGFLFEDGGVLEITLDAQGVGTNVLAFQDNADQQLAAFTGVAAFGGPVTLLELGPNSGVFANYDELDTSNLVITDGALRGTSATLDWDDTGYSAVVGFDFGTIDIVPADDEWNSGEVFEVVLNDQDANSNTRFDEDLDLNNPGVALIPSVQIGSPFTLENLSSAVFTIAAGTTDGDFFADGDLDSVEEVQAFSQRALLENEGLVTGAIAVGDDLRLTTTDSYGDLYDVLQQVTDTSGTTTNEQITNVFNYDFRSIFNSELTEGSGSVASFDVYLVGNAAAGTNAISGPGVGPTGGAAAAIALTEQAVQINTAGTLTDLQGEFLIDVIPGTGPLTGTAVDADGNSIADVLEFTNAAASPVELMIVVSGINAAGGGTIPASAVTPIVADFFSFGYTDDGEDPEERVANMIVRLELEENGDNTGEFVGELEFVMLNQLNILDASTFVGLGTIADDPTFIVSQDFTDEDSVRVNYNDLGSDGVTTPIADQEEAPSHSGVVSFDNDSYKIADTVTITLEDLDLNVDSDLIEIYSTVTPSISALLTFTDADADGIVEAGEVTVTRAGNLVQDSTGAGATDGFATFAGTTAATLVWTDAGALDGQVQIGELAGLPAGVGVASGTTAVIAATANDAAGSSVGAAGLPTYNFGSMGNLLNVTFDDELWAAQGATVNGANCDALNFPSFNDGFSSTGFTLVETGPETGVFIGDFQIPENYCTRASGAGAQTTTTGTDIEVNYIDYRDASGEIIEVGDSAGVRANTGSISLDRTVYPVPFGVPGDFAASTANDPAGRSVFPVHSTGVGTAGLTAGTTALSNGDLTIHLRVNDPDWDISAAGSDFINRDKADGTGVGPVKISVIRGADSVVLGYAGGAEAQAGHIDVGDDQAASTRDFGPIAETAPDSGIFEADIPVRYTDGPASSICPTTTTYSGLVDGTPATTPAAAAVAADGDLADQTDRFDIGSAAGTDYCILQGDILQVEYTDPEDASGDVNTVTDSATFDLRNGVLQTDKSVYIIGGDMIMTLIEPDFDLENDEAETYDLDLIEWDSDAATVTMGDLGGNAGSFDPEPTAFRETGDSTGIFQIVIEIPESLSGDNLERGEEIVLEYTDWGPSGSDYVGEEDEDVNVTVYTSNFGATVELDQKVYSWTDKVYITIVAPDHNFDSDLVDEIGNSGLDPIKISTRGSDIDNYKLVETGTDTGIFTGEVILTGFAHDADGDGTDDAPTQTPGTSADGSGPTDGFLGTDDDDGITVSFEFSEDETVVGSALVRWNIGEVQWLEASYPASGTGVVRVIDPDMNLDPEAVDNFDVDVWSDSDAGGIDLTVTETNEATGIFEGTVFFTTFDESSGHRLRVAEGDTVTAEYEDNTLPDPYTTADELDITATSLIGTVVPPLERAPAANLRTVDAFGNSLDTVSVDQQVQISADLANGQDKEQSFAYLVQIQDGNGVTVSLAWITGSLASGQSFSPALSWIPTEAGTYTATAFVWESVDNPTALSPPVSTTVTVN